MKTDTPLRTDSPNALGTELEARFFDLSIDMLCILDFDGHFRRLNRAWETTLGFTREELMSKRFIEFVHLEDRERTLQQNGKVRTGGEARFFENRYMCKDGSYRWLLWNSTPDPARQVIYGVARDITEVKMLQDMLPICSYCKRIRDDENYWQSVEMYFLKHSNTRFSHGVCPSCYERTIHQNFD